MTASENHVKFTKECVLVKKILTNGLNVILSLQDWIKNVHGMEIHGLSGKEKDLGAAVNKTNDY